MRGSGGAEPHSPLRRMHVIISGEASGTVRGILFQLFSSRPAPLHITLEISESVRRNPIDASQSYSSTVQHSIIVGKTCVVPILSPLPNCTTLPTYLPTDLTYSVHLAASNLESDCALAVPRLSDSSH